MILKILQCVRIEFCYFKCNVVRKFWDFCYGRCFRFLDQIFFKDTRIVFIDCVLNWFNLCRLFCCQEYPKKYIIFLSIDQNDAFIFKLKTITIILNLDIICLYR